MGVVLLLSVIMGMLYLSKDKTLFYVVLLYLFFVAKYFLLRYNITAPPAINYVILLMMFFTYALAKEKYLKVVVAYLSFFILFFLFKTLLSGESFFSFINTYKIGIIYLLGGIGLFDNIRYRTVNMRRLLRHLKYILAIQILFSWAQFLSPQIQTVMKVDGYTWNGVDVEFGFDRVMKSANMMFGLLFSPGNLSIFMAMTTGGLLSYMFYNDEFKLNDIILIGLSLATLFFTGVRTPFMVVVFMIFLFVYYYKRSYFKYAVVGGGILLFLLIFSNISDEESNIYRMQQGFGVLASGNTENVVDTTLGLTLLMLSYMFKSPIWGLSYGKYEIIPGIAVGDELSSSDAQLVYTICEIGFVGLVIVLYPFIKGVKLATRFGDNRMVVLILILGLLLTIVDLGIFLEECAFLVFFFFALYYYDSLYKNKQYGK